MVHEMKALDETPQPQKLQDARFRDLLGEAAWARLPQAINNRFSKRLSDDTSVVYQGTVVCMQMSLAGRVLAQAARLVGAPLPYRADTEGQPAVVTVTEDAATGGQFWIRQYGSPRGFPQIVHSSKRFQGPTGIEEYIGCGIGMALKVSATAESLLFKSDHYFVQLGKFRLRLPRWLGPGKLVIGHHDLGQGAFLFSLTLTSKLMGEMLHQDALFHDAKE